MENKDEKERELPKSLQGIEVILNYLNEKDKETSSIRAISRETGLSMRVTKNILLQLEKFNQIERVLEKYDVLPKWRITKFGKKVIKEARGEKKLANFPSREEELLYEIKIPENIDKTKMVNKKKQGAIISKLNTLQIELSKTLGPILNINDPIFEDLISFIIKKLKFLRQQILNLPTDPIAGYKLKKRDEKERKISKEEEKLLIVEIFFFNSLISNEIKRIIDFNGEITQFIENEAFSNAFSITKDLREEIRVLTSLIDQRGTINLDYHIVPKEDLKLLAKNRINPNILENIIEIQISEEAKIKSIEELVLKFIAKLDKGDKQLINHTREISDSIPLFELYELILDSKPNLHFTIDKLEQVINSLADNGYLAGIKIIQTDEDHYLKLVQFKSVDISKNELELILAALKMHSFTVADMVGATGWSIDQVVKNLNHLSDVGILRYSKSYLHGERWFIMSEKEF
ncbi:MAG: hypothetical protein V3V33_04500 [Candidatus Lokiarchaeia archaeon]